MSAKYKLTKEVAAKLALIEEDGTVGIVTAITLLYKMVILSKDHAFDVIFRDGRSFKITRKS